MTEFLSMPYILIMAPLCGVLFYYVIGSSSSFVRGSLACLGVLTLINGTVFLMSGILPYVYPTGFDAVIIGIVFLYSTLFASMFGWFGAFMVYAIKNFEIRKR